MLFEISSLSILMLLFGALMVKNEAAFGLSSDGLLIVIAIELRRD